MVFKNQKTDLSNLNKSKMANKLNLNVSETVKPFITTHIYIHATAV